MSERPECMSAGKDQPRVIKGEHFDVCNDSKCEGCWPCRERHCLSCGRRHAEVTCPQCIARTRADLTRIGYLCGFPLLEEALLQGVDSEAAMLLGPAAVPSEWQALTIRASMTDMKVAQAYLEDCRDELHPLWVLSWIETEWREAWGHEMPERHTIEDAADYISRMLHIIAGRIDTPDGEQGPEFADAKRKIADCVANLENVLSEGNRDELGAPCPKCGKGRLVKSYGDTDEDDRWSCRNRDCREWWTERDYRDKVGATYERHADALTASAIARVYRVSEGSVRGWASAKVGKVRKRGKDANGLQLYDVADVLAARDAKKEPA